MKTLLLLVMIVLTLLGCGSDEGKPVERRVESGKDYLYVLGTNKKYSGKITETEYNIRKDAHVLSYEGEFKNGVKHGVSKYYNKGGYITDEINFKNGVKTGPYKHYGILSVTGAETQLRKAGTYDKEGYLKGRLSYYFNDKEVGYIENYDQGYIDGKFDYPLSREGAAYIKGEFSLKRKSNSRLLWETSFHEKIGEVRYDEKDPIYGVGILEKFIPFDELLTIDFSSGEYKEIFKEREGRLSYNYELKDKGISYSGSILIYTEALQIQYYEREKLEFKIKESGVIEMVSYNRNMTELEAKENAKKVIIKLNENYGDFLSMYKIVDLMKAAVSLNSTNVEESHTNNKETKTDVQLQQDEVIYYPSGRVALYYNEEYEDKPVLGQHSIEGFKNFINEVKTTKIKDNEIRDYYENYLKRGDEVLDQLEVALLNKNKTADDLRYIEQFKKLATEYQPIEKKMMDKLEELDKITK